MKIVIGIASFIGGVAVCYLLLSMGLVAKIGQIPSVPNDPGQTVSIYLSFVSVMLTAVTVVITAVTIGIGVVAAYTFTGLKHEARMAAQSIAEEKSQSTARDVAAEALSEVKIKNIVETYLAGYFIQKDQKLEWGEESNEQVES